MFVKFHETSLHEKSPNVNSRQLIAKTSNYQMPQHYHEEIVGRGEAAQRLRGGLWSEKLGIDW